MRERIRDPVPWTRRGRLRDSRDEIEARDSGVVELEASARTVDRRGAVDNMHVTAMEPIATDLVL